MSIDKDKTLSENYRFLVEHTNDFLYRHDTNGVFFYMSPSVEKLTGYSIKEWYAHYSKFFTNNPINKQAALNTEDTLKTGKLYPPYPIELRCKNGATITLEVSEKPYRNEDGNIAGIVGVARDITDRVIAQQKLETTIKELTKSNSELTRFAHIASHDLQEPLRSIYSYTQLLEEEYKDLISGEGTEYIQKVKESVERMNNLIADLLEHSKLSAEVKSFSDVNCNEVCQITIANLASIIEEIYAKITIDDLPTIKADKTQIIQLFQNIISNAIKYHSSSRQLEIHISATEKDNNWLFSISDNGIGIEKINIEKIFSIFVHLHSKKEYPGTGMGLAICKKVVENHNGKIWALSEIDKGSTFYFTLAK